MLPAGPNLEAGLAEALDCPIEVIDDDRGVAVRRHDRRGVAFEVDLRALPFDPDEGLGQRRRRLDPPEPEQLPELDRGLDVFRRHLERHVLQHTASIGTSEQQ